MNNDKDPKWSGKNQPHGRQPDHQNQSGPPDDSVEFHDEERLPDQVTDSLKTLDQYDQAVPDLVRSAILKDAADVLKRQKIQPARSTPLWSRGSWLGISTAVMASALLIAIVLPRGADPLNGPANSSVQLADTSAGVDSQQSQIPMRSGKDVDGNGRVNILDAFALARTVEGDQTNVRFELAELDQNGDGVVNSDDVNSIAMSVVML